MKKKKKDKLFISQKHLEKVDFLLLFFQNLFFTDIYITDYSVQLCTPDDIEYNRKHLCSAQKEK